MPAQRRPTTAHISLSAIAHNLGLIRTLAPDCVLCPVIKADAYGHGAVRVATYLSQRIDAPEWLAVALIEEGVALRAAGIVGPLLVLGGLDHSPDDIVQHKLTPTLWRVDQLQRLSAAVQKYAADGDNGYAFHLKVDTGMRRLGHDTLNIEHFAQALSRYSNLRLEGLLTHFANADLGDRDFNTTQVQALSRIEHTLHAQGLCPRWVHLANSAAVLDYPPVRTSFVRPGLMLYGLDPRSSAGGEPDPRLQPALRWVTKPLNIVHVRKGERVSYGGTWIAKKDSRIAVLPMGYADGYPRIISNRGQVLIAGRRVPLVGNICMDLMLVDVSALSAYAEDALRAEEVVVIGTQGQERIRAEDVAGWAETISYEIVCGVGRRVPRVYTE